MSEEQILRIPKHTNKPRKSGITEVMDVGIPTDLLKSYLADHHEFIDYIKFGIGSAYVTPNLSEKIKIIKDHNISVWFGGTLFEKFYSQDCYHQYIDYLKKYEIDCIEISTGTIDLDLDQRLTCVEQAKDEFTIFSEVGSKDQKKVMPPSEWVNEIKELLKAGSDYVILEGRDSASAGIYNPDGHLKEGLLAEIIKEIDVNKIIFEAPVPKAQIHFLNLLGTNVNLGNVKLQDVLLLESQRCALRSDTFFLDDPHRDKTQFCERRI